jgi:hypothetical protein
MSEMIASLFVILVGILAWSFFMFRMQRELLLAHRELVGHLVQLKVAQANALFVPRGTHLPQVGRNGRLEAIPGTRHAINDEGELVEVEEEIG